MKTAIALILLLLFAGEQPAKVKFSKGNLKTIVHKAKTEDKLIFIFVGSDHCDLCVQTKESFRDQEVADFYNKNFVNYRMDPDNMSNNFRLGNWGVGQVPYFLYMDAQKNIVYRAYGKQDAYGMLKHGSAALDSFKVYCARKR